MICWQCNTVVEMVHLISLFYVKVHLDCLHMIRKIVKVFFFFDIYCQNTLTIFLISILVTHLSYNLFENNFNQNYGT